MKSAFAVLNTDQLNRQNLFIPASTLIEALESHVAQCAHRGMPVGTPMHLSHDVHRPVGWSISAAVHLGSDMARQLGVLCLPESPEEYEALDRLREAYWRHYHHDAVEPYVAELAARLLPADVTEAKWMRAEAPALVRPGLAAEVYPEFFKSEGGLVDKDGLVDYAALQSRMKEVVPGVFHDPDRNLVLFAHRFFRRNLSHANALNTYVLGSFAGIAAENPNLRARLRLDPDIVGHPDAAKGNIELEYWRGPKFVDDIASIPDGVAEHKASDSQRLYGGIDKTQIWWKAPEVRSSDGGGTLLYRTFEIEELIEDACAGLDANHYGCRYAHAEYSTAAGSISHFDGAIRAYGPEEYLQRIDTSIDRAGKHAAYTKLFRIDGELPLPSWKRLLSDWYRGNDLVPEYLGVTPDTSTNSFAPAPSAEAPSKEPSLCALVTIARAALPETSGLSTQTLQLSDHVSIRVVELGDGAVADLMRERGVGASEAVFDDGILNLSTVAFGDTAMANAEWPILMKELAAALEVDMAAGRIARASVAVSWPIDTLLFTLSAAGDVAPLAALLLDAGSCVRPEQPASSWIDRLNDSLHTHSIGATSPIDWEAASPFSGRLTLPRGDGSTFSVRVSDADATNVELAAAWNELAQANK
ncbi:MAG: hypothetical protein Q7J28_14875 [Caulobacter sp.]|nr:hypothetical protein [Caulobacter sp.]